MNPGWYAYKTQLYARGPLGTLVIHVDRNISRTITAVFTYEKDGLTHIQQIERPTILAYARQYIRQNEGEYLVPRNHTKALKP